MGALTSKPYAFVSRPWELKSIETIDFFDTLGTNIRVDIRGSDILRILPAPISSNNLPFISDKIRFAYDSLKVQRINLPLLRFSFLTDLLTAEQKALGTYTSLLPVSSKFFFSSLQKTFFKYYYNALKNKEAFNIYSFSGPFTSIQDFLSLKYYLPKLSVRNSFLQTVDKSESVFSRKQTHKILNFSEYNNVVLLGSNLRLEAPLIYLALKTVSSKLNIFSFGSKARFSFRTFDLSNNLNFIEKLFTHKHPLSKKLLKDERTLFVYGSTFISKFSTINSQTLEFFIKQFNLLSSASKLDSIFIPSFISRLSEKEIGFYNKGQLLQSPRETYWTFNFANDTFSLLENSAKNPYIYLGFSGDVAASKAWFIYPSFSPFETFGSYLTLNNLYKTSRLCVESPFLARSIYNFLLSFVSYSIHHKMFPNILLPQPFSSQIYFIDDVNKYIPSMISSSVLEPFISNFYKSDILTRSSKTLSLAAYRFRKYKHSFNN